MKSACFTLAVLIMLMLCGCGNKKTESEVEIQNNNNTAETTVDSSESSNEETFAGYTHGEMEDLIGQKFEEVIKAVEPVVTNNYPLDIKNKIDINGKTYYKIRSDFCENENDLRNYLMEYMTESMADMFYSNIDTSVLYENSSGFYSSVVYLPDTLVIKSYTVRHVELIDKNRVKCHISYKYKDGSNDKVQDGDTDFELEIVDNHIKVSLIQYPTVHKSTGD